MNLRAALAEALRRMDTDTDIQHMYLPCADPDPAYSLICELMTEVDAAGGIVKSGDGRYIVIRRRGVWDLPKGKREPGEDIADNAVREVMEECGIVAGLQIVRKICVTDHTYHHDGDFVLKHTHWFEMSLTDTSALKPQTEEEISEAVWVTESELRERIAGSFPSLQEIVKTYFSATEL